MAFTTSLPVLSSSSSSTSLLLHRNHRHHSISSSSSSATNNTNTAIPPPTNTENDSDDKKFTYTRASPSVRWPHFKLHETYPSLLPINNDKPLEPNRTGSESGSVVKFGIDDDETEPELETEALREPVRSTRNKVKKLNKLALKRAKDWRERVRFLTQKILALEPDRLVADVLDNRTVQMTPTDFCFVVKWVGEKNWQRALEVYEWLNLRNWYSPNPRMVSTIIAILGRNNQEGLGFEIFNRVEDSVGNCVQVYNAMMGVYARSGSFVKVQELLDLMRERGCEPDLVSFNTLINARLKAGAMPPNLAFQLLDDVRKAGLRPDIITYNTLLSACSRHSNLEEAVRIFEDMVARRCQPDLWTYNAMISVCARCGQSGRAEQLFKELQSRGFFPDSVTYNSLLFAFAREGNVEKVKDICDEMVSGGFGKDEMTYNTIINMYGKQGRHDLALQVYRDLKSSGRSPDAVTYTVLIDSLGKANKVEEAASVMSEMLDTGVKPTLRTYSALICAYAKVGKRVEAEETYNCMLRSGIKPDRLAYSVMMDVFLRADELKKAMVLYREMAREGIMPDLTLLRTLFLNLGRENKEEDVEEVVEDMVKHCGMSPEAISSVLVRGECYEAAAKMLRMASGSGSEIDRENLLSILSSYSSSGRHSEALDLLDFLKKHASVSSQLISEALVVVRCKALQLTAALEEYNNFNEFSLYSASDSMYESLIQCCGEMELITEACRVFSDMRFYGCKPSQSLYESMIHMYCKIGLPETACHLIDLAETYGIVLDRTSFYVELIEAYGNVKLWHKAESIVEDFKERSQTVDRKVWNALIQAYAQSGCYERARAVFNTMMRDGPSPSVDSINGMLQALIVDGRLEELYVVVQELQDMGFQISKSSILLMLDAFARAGNIFEVKKIYNGMKAAGYFPTMFLYRIMTGLFCRGRRVRDVEALVLEMEEAGFKPDLAIRNAMLKLYTGINDFRKATQIYQQLKEEALEPDEDTYNTLIVMYCRDCRPEEGLSLMHEMRRAELEPKLDTYHSLISSFAKKQAVEHAEALFEELLTTRGHKLNRSFYHMMMKMYRNCGNHAKAERLLSVMKDSGVQPSIATMHLLMLSYGSSGQPEEAQKVLANLKETGLDIGTLPYSAVIDAFLRKKEYDVGIQKLHEMKEEGPEPDHKIWTCFIRTASLAENTSEALVLLNALRDVGFDLPVRLLTEKSETLISEVNHCLEKLEMLEDDAALNFVNALEDLLWAFELRATASWIFQLAIGRKIYSRDVFRVADKDWGADFRKLSGGAALVALTLWLDHMQDASLEGQPESPKSVVLITGTAEYNMVSLNSTLKAILWEMGSPFLPCKTRTGLLVAKAHSLRMWLKDSPFCLDLELKNAPSLPKTNSMQLIEGCFIRRGLVPAFKEINEKLRLVRPKKFAKLALLSDESRGKAIQAYIDGREGRMEKMKAKVELKRKRIVKKLKRRKYIRQAMLSRPEEFPGRYRNAKYNYRSVKEA